MIDIKWNITHFHVFVFFFLQVSNAYALGNIIEFPYKQTKK